MRPAQAFVLAAAGVVAVVIVPDSFPHRHSGVETPADLPVREPAAPPYPFCRTPEKCAGKGYCPRDPACND